MKEWYLEHTPPTVTSTYENNAISEYAQSNFTDVLLTDFSDEVVLYNSDLSESKVVRCIIQGNVPSSQLKSLQREILFPIGTAIAGQYVFFENSYWLLTGYVGNNKCYEKITASLCVLKLRWQNTFGNIIERYVYTEDFTKYSSGTIGNNTLQLGDNQYGIYIPIDDETKKLKRDIRFAIDFEDADEPDIYALTNRKVAICNYQSSDKGGNIILTLSFNAFNKNTDKRVKLEDGTEVWICDYKEQTGNVPSDKPPTEPIEPIEPSEPTEPIQADMSCTISGGSTIKVTRNKTWTAKFKDADGNDLDSTNIGFIWKIISDFNVEQVVTDNKIQLRVNDENAIEKSFLLQVLVDEIIYQSVEIFVTELV